MNIIEWRPAKPAKLHRSFIGAVTRAVRVETQRLGHRPREGILHVTSGGLFVKLEVTERA